MEFITNNEETNSHVFPVKQHDGNNTDMDSFRFVENDDIINYLISSISDDDIDTDNGAINTDNPIVKTDNHSIQTDNEPSTVFSLGSTTALSILKRKNRKQMFYSIELMKWKVLQILCFNHYNTTTNNNNNNNTHDISKKMKEDVTGLKSLKLSDELAASICTRLISTLSLSVPIKTDIKQLTTMYSSYSHEKKKNIWYDLVSDYEIIVDYLSIGLVVYDD